MIQETKCDRTSMGNIKKKIWKGCEVEVVDSNGALSGLTILRDHRKWKLDLFVLSPRILTTSFKGLGSQSYGFIRIPMALISPFSRESF